MANMVTSQSRREERDYVGAYERAIANVVSACGSREAANMMLSELQDHYTTTEKKLDAIDRMRARDPEKYVREKASMLANARAEVNLIIERHAPHLSDQMRELIIGASLAAMAVTLPAAALSTLSVATALAAIGGSYYIGFKMLRNWRAISGKAQVSRMAGLVGPKHAGGVGKIVQWAKK